LRRLAPKSLDDFLCEALLDLAETAGGFEQAEVVFIAASLSLARRLGDVVEYWRFIFH
jgi:hypothetical protein